MWILMLKLIGVNWVYVEKKTLSAGLRFAVVVWLWFKVCWQSGELTDTGLVWVSELTQSSDMCSATLLLHFTCLFLQQRPCLLSLTVALSTLPRPDWMSSRVISSFVWVLPGSLLVSSRYLKWTQQFHNPAFPVAVSTTHMTHCELLWQ